MKEKKISRISGGELTQKWGQINTTVHRCRVISDINNHCIYKKTVEHGREEDEKIVCLVYIYSAEV